MGLFTPQTVVSFLIFLHIQEISSVGCTWITPEVFNLKTQEVLTFSLLAKADTVENNEEVCIYFVFSPLPNNLPFPLLGKYCKLRKLCQKTKSNPNTKWSEGYPYIFLIQKYIHRCQEIICKLLTSHLMHLISIYYILATYPKVIIRIYSSGRAEEQPYLPNQNNRNTKSLPLLQEAKQCSCRALMPSQVTYTEIFIW